MEKEDKRLVAIVTGASSGIGKAIGNTLVSMGYEVYGLARHFTQENEQKGWHQIECDITDSYLLEKCMRAIRKKKDIHILVNNAGVGYYGLHEELRGADIRRLVRTNLEAPMVLSQLLLRDLKKTQGYIFNISSVTALQKNPHGCAYGATKAGLTSFSRSLFEETRKYGVKVISIQPDMTDTQLYRHANFTVEEGYNTSLYPEDVAKAVQFVLEAREGIVVNEITLRPQLHRIKRKK